MINITPQIQEAVKSSGVRNGVCTVFVPHTTAGVTINENADPDVVSDMLKEINKIVPFDDNYSHMEGNSAAHIKASLFGFSQQVIINEGRLVLGTWQSIYFCEFDGPRNRNKHINISEN
jgi:secondary thiamine-phosphate synthase enzyme